LPAPVGPITSVCQHRDVKRQPERCRTFGLGEQKRRAAEMLVALRPAHTAESGIMCARFKVETAADARWRRRDWQTSEPRLDGVDALGNAREIASLDHLLDERSFSSATRASSSQTVTVAVT